MLLIEGNVVSFDLLCFVGCKSFNLAHRKLRSEIMFHSILFIFNILYITIRLMYKSAKLSWYVKLKKRVFTCKKRVKRVLYCY